jgi:hypothetical protein
VSWRSERILAGFSALIRLLCHADTSGQRRGFVTDSATTIRFRIPSQHLPGARGFILRRDFAKMSERPQDV